MPTTQSHTAAPSPPRPFHRSSFRIHRSPSLRPLFEDLQNASTHLDDILQTLDLSKQETEEILISQKYATHRQLRTQLLQQQLQLLAQNHAHHALQRLLDLTDSRHPATARLATTQLLAFANLLPHPHPAPPPKSPGIAIPEPTPSPTNTPPTGPAPFQTSEFNLQNSPPQSPPPPRVLPPSHPFGNTK